MRQLILSMNEGTEDLWQYILENISDSALDEIEVDRDIKDPSSLASEPVTAALILSL